MKKEKRNKPEEERAVQSQPAHECCISDMILAPAS